MKKKLVFLTTLMILIAVITSCKKKKDVPTPTPTDVRVYELTYQTPGVDGSMLTASGIVMVPPTGNGPFPLLSAQHGTIFDRHVAPPTWIVAWRHRRG